LAVVLFKLALPKVTFAPFGALTTLQTPEPTVGKVASKPCVFAQTAPEAVVMLEAEGLSRRVMVTVLILGVQVPLEIVQVKTFAPIAKPLTVVVALFALLNVKPAPDQVPVPIVGTLPAKVVLLAHTICAAPALDTEGLASLVIVTVLSLGTQVPLEIVHLKI
jgi:hypothetical protein